MKKSSDHHHEWEKVERTLDDGFSYYYLICKVCHEVRFPARQLQNLQDYSKAKLFIFVQDWVLLLLYAGHEYNREYIAGITLYQKMLFLIFHEFAPKFDIPTENPGFYGYKYGPYSSRIDSAINFLIQQGYITTRGRRSSSFERFYITAKGKEKGKKIFDKLSNEQQRELVEFRMYWDQKGRGAICKYIYAKPEYEVYLDKSLILSDLFPGKTLHRRRG
ncbi:MAG TPA: hypothetical protein PLQ49_05410 [Methanothrix sp.]|nr:hypothetical protein [Methanothrix sp.]